MKKIQENKDLIIDLDKQNKALEEKVNSYARYIEKESGKN